MKPSPELIQKFLRDQCTDKEAELVHAWLQDHPEDLERYIPANDWLVESGQQVDTSTSARMLQSVRKSYRTPNYILLKQYAVAASILAILAIAGLKLLSTNVKQELKTIAKISVAPNLQLLNNPSSQVLHELLPDSSLVSVYPNSSLEYLPQFEKSKRDLYLKGKAEFKVSKDQKRPFTVYAAGISTTALGTQFTVTVKQNQQVVISLQEGLIKIKSLHAEEKDAFVILRPGDKLMISSGHFKQHTLIHKSIQYKKAVIEKGQPVQNENNLVFKNEPLKNVLKRIEKKFNVTVDHSKAPGMEEKLFTGSFLETEDLEFIVKLICQLHGFKYSIDGSRVMIHR